MMYTGSAVWSGPTYRVVARVQFVEKALVPSIDAVLEHPCDALQQTLSALPLVGQDKFEVCSEILGLDGVHQDIARVALGVKRKSAGLPVGRGIICGSYKRHN
jgi:hypothetical protein